MDKKSVQKLVDKAFKAINDANEKIKDTIIEVISSNGGLMKTIPDGIAPRVVATTIWERSSGEETETETIYGVRASGGKIYICTETSLSNYQYDSGYQFSSDYFFEGEDLEHLEEMLSDEIYFIEVDNDEYLEEPTLMSILGALTSYVQ